MADLTGSGKVRESISGAFFGNFEIAREGCSRSPNSEAFLCQKTPRQNEQCSGPKADAYRGKKRKNRHLEHYKNLIENCKPKYGPRSEFWCGDLRARQSSTEQYGWNNGDEKISLAPRRRGSITIDEESLETALLMDSSFRGNDRGNRVNRNIPSFPRRRESINTKSVK